MITIPSTLDMEVCKSTTTITKLISSFFSLVIFISSVHMGMAARPYKPHNQQIRNTSTDEFIKNSCGVTMYPKLCFKSLSAYASTIQTSPKQLANIALAVSLTCARSTSAVMFQLPKRREMKPREAAAIRDCVENIGDSVSELQESLEEMKHLGRGGSDFHVQMDNIQTWVSAALTNEDTCMDGFEGNSKKDDESIKSVVRSNIVNVAQLTSNALALINNLSPLPVRN